MFKAAFIWDLHFYCYLLF